MGWVTDVAGGVEFRVRACPRAAKNAVQGVIGDSLKVRLCAPPVDGAANAALAEFLADALGVSKGKVRIVAGATSREKRVAVAGVDAATAKERLGVP
jgi:hypothetical protein